MAERSSTGRGIGFWIVMALFFEFAVIVLFVPRKTMVGAIAKQQRLNTQFLGADVSALLKNNADAMFVTVLDESGVREAINYYLLDRWEASEKEARGHIDDRGVSQWFEKRLVILWAACWIALYRLAGMLMWSIYIVPFLIPAVIDALLSREIQKWKFSFVSPLMRASSYRLTFTLFAITAMFLIAPFSVPSLWQPVILLGMTVGVWLFVRNLQKRL